MTTSHLQTLLRSPREKLDGYILLPRLIDKVRAHARGMLPEVYHRNLLRPGLTLDGRLLTFTGVDGEALREMVVTSDADEPIIRWITEYGHSHSEEDKQRWAEEVEAYRPSGRVLLYLQATHPELAARVDFTRFSLLDLLDMDEGRLSIPSSAG